jgi:lysophospholipase L1-like esterase
MSYYNTKEAFTSSTKSFILLGDSILKNDAYVSNGKSVANLVAERNQNIYCFAEDDSKIIDVYSQIDKIPHEFDSPNTLIFLSAGGNDILSHYLDQNQEIKNTSVLNPMFSVYKNLIKSIQKRMPQSKIILFDIYYPDNVTYKQYHFIIDDWNNMIYNFAENHKNKIYGLIRISSHLTQNEDFSFGIEPSSSGGQKIADLILSSY